MNSGTPDAPVPMYTASDFDLINRHADETYTRVRQVTNLRRVGIYRRFSLYTGAMILALVLAAWAYAIAFGPPRLETRIVEIERPSVVKEEVIVDVSDDATGDFPEFEVLKERLENLELVNPPAADAIVVTDYTLFETVHYGVGGITSVVTGVRFETSESEFPEFQYCYVELPLHGGAKKTIYIAEKTGHTSPDIIDITRELADAVGTTIGVLNRAQGLCRFRL